MIASIRLQRQNKTTENINLNSCCYGIFTGVVVTKITFHLYPFCAECPAVLACNESVQVLHFFHWLYSPLGPWPLIFSFMIILQTVGLLGRVISSSQGLYLNTGQHKHRINTYQTSMPCVGLEPTIPAFYQAKTVHALDRSATVTGSASTSKPNKFSL
jgi:hypothetical protein